MTNLSHVPPVLLPLLPELAESLEACLSACRVALQGGDALAAAGQAHAVKGAAMRFGLPDLAVAAGKLDECCRELAQASAGQAQSGRDEAQGGRGQAQAQGAEGQAQGVGMSDQGQCTATDSLESLAALTKVDDGVAALRAALRTDS